MRRTQLPAIFTLKTVAAMATALILSAGCWAASQETLLHSFQPGGDGTGPQSAGVIADAKGNLYGVTTTGGSGGLGAVYELSPQHNGAWTETLLYSFLNNGSDGSSPVGSLVFDTQGNLFGVTTQGGSSGDGTVYQLTPTTKGPWKETILHDFNCHTAQDGCRPASSLISDQVGNLYGETVIGACTQGGGMSCGTIFELSPRKGLWVEAILHRFAAGLTAKGGSAPGSGMIWDKDGSLYGVCSTGGPWGWGLVWELSPVKNGKWQETVLWEFGPAVNNPPFGGGPDSSLVMDNAGNLYGVTPYGGGGPGGGGVVYELSPGSKGKWTESRIHAFFESKTDSDGMYANSVAIDAGGNLYGTAFSGGGIGEAKCGTYSGCGVVFRLTPGPNGKWKETILHRFTDNTGNGDGGVPWPDKLLLDSAGNVYGTTQYGGATNSGSVFEIKP